MGNSPFHQSVLLRETMEFLEPKSGEKVLDVTLGLGGHAAVFLEKIGPNGMLIGLDADETNLAYAQEKLSMFGASLTLHHGNFSDLADFSLADIDILFADLGLSSPHVDDPERGFSFRAEGPLDLRYDQSTGRTASDIIQASEADELSQMFRAYGELFKEARRLGSALAGTRYETTSQLRTAVEKIFGFRAPPLLPRIFQALRIAVNDELHALENLLREGPKLLAVGGRMGIISYHSLEDRMVKHVFRALSTGVKDPVTGKLAQQAPFELVTPKAIVPGSEEITQNPRSRSAKFRVLRRRM